MKYYSQINQDEYVIDYFKNKNNGFFIDIGANDGVTFSNTKALEELGWKGICVEANKQAYLACENNRQCKCINVAVHNKVGTATFSSPPDSLVGGLKETFTPGHVRQWGKRVAFTETQVKTNTLLNILNECNAPLHIEYLSLDTEGSEGDILEHFFQYNCNKYHIKYIDVEHNFNGQIQRRLLKLFEDNDYKLSRQNQWDWTVIKK